MMDVYQSLIFPISSSWIRTKLSGEIRPGCGHLWHTLVTKIEMMSFLIILDLICSKDWVSFVRIILKFASCRTFEISWISTKFVMSCYLI